MRDGDLALASLATPLGETPNAGGLKRRRLAYADIGLSVRAFTPRMLGHQATPASACHHGLFR